MITTALPPVSQSPDYQLPEADRLFFALDRRTIGSNAWTAHVLGIHAESNGWWIQVGRADDAAVSVVLRVPREVPVDRLLAVLATWTPVNADLEVKYVA